MSGYGELSSYVDDVAYNMAAELAEKPESDQTELRIKKLEEEVEKLREGINKSISRLQELIPYVF